MLENYILSGLPGTSPSMSVAQDNHDSMPRIEYHNNYYASIEMSAFYVNTLSYCKYLKFTEIFNVPCFTQQFFPDRLMI